MGETTKKEEERKEIKDNNLMAEITYQRQFNIGKYENEQYKIGIQGSYNDVVNGKSLIPNLMPVIFNMQLVIEKTQKRIKIEDVQKKTDTNVVDAPVATNNAEYIYVKDSVEKK
jgi:hypothetical protein